MSFVIDIRALVWCISVTGLSEHWWQCVLIKLKKKPKKGCLKKREMLNYVLSASYTIQQNCVYIISILYICVFLCDPCSTSLYSVWINKKTLPSFEQNRNGSRVRNTLNCTKKGRIDLMQVISLSSAILTLSSCHNLFYFAYSNTLLQLKIHIYLKKAVTCLPKETYTA